MNTSDLQSAGAAPPPSRNGGDGGHARPAEPRSSASRLRDTFLGRLSIEHKLPLIFGVLVVIIVTALAVAAYREGRASAIRAASLRLTSLTTQFRDLYAQSGTQIKTGVAALAAKPAVAEYARTRNARLRDSALAALRYSGANPEQVLGTELRTAESVILLTTGSRLRTDTITPLTVIDEATALDSTVIGRFRFVNDTLIYAVAAPVREARGTFVVVWRRMAGTRRAREQITQLVGSEASIFLGNPGRGQWTNLERPVEAPPVNLRTRERVQSYVRENQEYLASSAAVPGTPWVLAIDFPMNVVLEATQNFLRRMTLIAALALALGLVGVWIVSRRISRPLRQLTDAAATIAGGDYRTPVVIQRSDELGRLGQAFAIMASEVQSARDHLERKVDERTRDLNATLQQLHDAQETLVRREKLALLGQLASGVGHELRNPLGVMTNAVYYLKTVMPDAPRNVIEYLDILQQQITLSEKIVGDLLDFARSKPPQRLAVPLAPILQTQVERVTRPRDITIDVDVPSELPNVMVDAVQIGQIVLNLLTNAVQSINGNGGRVEVRARVAGDQVQCEVTDTGGGIPKENLDKIFEPLFTTKARGIGLGLAVSRTLARANQGDLTVSSTVGQGSTFRLWLPKAEGK